jgi:hypothetical protein
LTSLPSPVNNRPANDQVGLNRRGITYMQDYEPELDQQSEDCFEEKSITAEEFSILNELFDRGDVQADIEGSSLTFRARIEGEGQRRFARIRLLPFAHQLAHRVLQTGGESEMLTLIGLLDRMKGILTEYLETDDLSATVEVVDDDQFTEELEEYQSNQD